MTDRDIVDRIDRLVGEQLASFDARSGYDANVNQENCPHCGRDWHGLAITERMQRMRLMRRFDTNYRHDADTSRVLCPGAMFVGPIPPETSVLNGFDVLAAWRNMVRAAQMDASGGESPTHRTVSSGGSQAERSAPGVEPHSPVRFEGEAPEIGVTGGSDRAAWHCAVCHGWATVAETGGESNAFANALHGYAAHIAREHGTECSEALGAEEFATRFGLPARGVLWDAEHRVIGTFVPGGSAFERGASARDLKGFGASAPQM